ncbi:MAG: hypothetical protein JRH16_20675 [Deltaproteobacteria bacterium]|nr:hypothetical protein [Deltaproteobacteria bacterium]MBW2363315.1 hypothetical protein [Deltaproteobacteria bacterium]
MSRGFLVAGLLAAVTFAGVADPSAAETDLLSLPMPPEGGPVVVRVAFDLRDINRIDDETETFEFEGVLVSEWHDDRQAFDPAVEGVREKLYQGSYQFDELSPAWFPQLVLVNESGLYEKHGVQLRVRPDGSLRLVEMVNAAAKTDLALRRYPFDRQRLEAIFEVLGFDEREVVLRPIEAGESPAPEAALRMPQWRLTGIAATSRSHPVSHAGAFGVASTFVLSMDVERRSFFMVRLVVVPLLLIVMLSWSVFWMDQSSVGDRVSVSFIGILTVVTYQIVLSETLPRIAYLTLMNGFLNTCFFIMCASVFVNLWVGRLDRRGESERGDKIDQRCRWIFPAVYLGLLLLMGVLAFFVFE